MFSGRLQSGSDSPSEASEPQEAEQKRLQLLATLLRAIEESSGGSLSHLEEPEDGDESLQLDVGGRGLCRGPASHKTSSYKRCTEEFFTVKAVKSFKYGQIFHIRFNLVFDLLFI